MIQIIGYILMGIGGLTVIFIAYKFPTWFGAMLEAGGRNQFPLDYLPALSKVISFFEKNGFTKGDLINPGSDKPGIEMVKEGHTIEIYLDAPLDEKQKDEIEIVFKAQSIKIRTLKMTDECSKLLSEALKL